MIFSINLPDFSNLTERAVQAAVFLGKVPEMYEGHNASIKNKNFQCDSCKVSIRVLQLSLTVVSSIIIIAMIQALILFLGIIALLMADLNSQSILLSIFFPIIILFYLCFQFIDFVAFLKREGVWTGSPDDNYVEMLTALYADRNYKYEGLLASIPYIGWLLLEMAIWLDLGVFAYSLVFTFGQLGKLLYS